MRLAGGPRARLGRRAARRQSDADGRAADAVSARDRRDRCGRPHRGAEPRACRADHHARRRHAGCTGRGDAVAAHHDAGAVWLRRSLLLARYDGTANPAALHGDELVGPGLLDRPAGRRVPVSNPTQGGAPTRRRSLPPPTKRRPGACWRPIARATCSSTGSCRFATPTRARSPAGSRISPTGPAFRPRASIQLCFTHASEAEPWQPIWLFHEAYYQSMVYRLMVLGGAARRP